MKLFDLDQDEIYEKFMAIIEDEPGCHAIYQQYVQEKKKTHCVVPIQRNEMLLKMVIYLADKTERQAKELRGLSLLNHLRPIFMEDTIDSRRDPEEL